MLSNFVKYTIKPECDTYKSKLHIWKKVSNKMEVLPFVLSLYTLWFETKAQKINLKISSFLQLVLVVEKIIVWGSFLEKASTVFLYSRARVDIEPDVDIKVKMNVMLKFV
jgi:hypothetical protein